MSIDITKLENVHRLLFEIPLVPIQGKRFQPTGFPGLGAATFQTPEGTSLLVESAQSMANRLEMACWDEARNDVKPELAGISHIKVLRNGAFLTDSVLEAHRINSPYLLENSDKTFMDKFKEELKVLGTGPIDRGVFAKVLFKYDIGSLLHGVFLAKKDLAGGRLRLSRVISAFIEANEVQVAASGGVKNDHVDPSGDTKQGFGNVPFARDEFTAKQIVLYVNIDLAQIRGYGLDANASSLLVLLALYKLRALIDGNDGNLRLRTACDFKVAESEIRASAPAGYILPTLADLITALKPAISACADQMKVTETINNDEPKKGKDSKKAADVDKPDDSDEEESEV